MAQFKYLGEPKREWVIEYGPTLELRVPKKDGTKVVLKNSDGFPIGEVIPFEFTDERSIRFLRADVRFEEV